MTIEEVKALIAKGLEGQGSAIDAGGVLPKVLNGIIDIVVGEKKKVEVPNLSSFTTVSKAQAAAALEISESDLDSLFEADVITSTGENGTATLCLTNRFNTLDASQYAAFGSSAGELGSFAFEIFKSSDKYSALYTEV